MDHSAFQIIFFLLKFLKNKRRKIKVYTLGLWFIKGHKNSPVHRDIWEETVQILKQHYYFFWDIQWNACNLHRVSWPGFDIPSKVFLYVFFFALKSVLMAAAHSSFWRALQFKYFRCFSHWHGSGNTYFSSSQVKLANL